MNHSTFTRPSCTRNLVCCIAAMVGITIMSTESTSLSAFAQTAPPPTSSPNTSNRSATTRPATTRSTTARPMNRTAARPLPPVRTSTPKALLDEAQRALKLGSSYREARNYDLAQKYIQRGIELANKAGNRYWEATGYEYLGLVYRDIGDREAALSALQKASDMFTGIIKQPNGSQNSTQALMDDVRRNDRSRPPASTSSGISTPPPPTDLERERTMNRQLSERIQALESKIRALEDRSTLSVSPGASPVIVSPSTPPPQVRASESSPGVIARTMPRQAPDGGQPQAEFAPFQTEKKPRPEPQQTRPAPTPARAVVMDVITLPTFTLQIGVGVGYNLNTKQMATRLPTTLVEGAVNGNAPLISFPLLSISGDFFLSPNFSLGLMYGYYPGPDQTTTSTITTGTPSATTSLTTRTTTSYHLVTLRPSVHFVRDRNVDVYVGLALGTLVNLPLFDPLRLYAGLMAGFQYNFTRQVGMFMELSGGGIYVGDSSVEKVLLTTPGNPLIQVGAYGRLGIAINF